MGDKMELYFPEREFVLGVKVAGTAAFFHQEYGVNTPSTSNRHTNNESCLKKHIAQIHLACDLGQAQHNVKRGTLKVKYKTALPPPPPKKRLRAINTE